MIKRLFTTFVAIMLIIISIAMPVMANIDSLLDDIVAGTYVQEPGVYKSPSTTTLSGGSFSFRLRNDILGRPIINLRAPQASISCAGMDFDAGMLSLLNLDTFEQMLSQGGASLAWGIMIGLVYSLPGIGEAFQKLNEWARDIQKLMGNPCAIGKQIGQSIATDVLGVKPVEKAEKKSLLENLPFSETMKKILNEIDLNEMVVTYPFGSLSAAGIRDTEIAQLFAAMFGVLDVYFTYNNTRIPPHVKLGTACGGKPCGAESLTIDRKPPLTQSLDAILYGGNIKTYYCAGAQGQVCTGGTPETTISTRGLVPKLADKFTRAIDSFKMGGWVDNESEIAVYNTIIPQLSGIINYAASLKKFQGARGSANAKRAAYVMAEYVSVMMLRSLADEMAGYIYTAVGSNLVKGKDAEIKEYLKKIEDGRRMVDAKADQITSNYQLLVQSFQNFKSTKDYLDRNIEDKIGKAALLFR